MKDFTNKYKRSGHDSWSNLKHWKRRMLRDLKRLLA